jgi:hypothetical protein
VTAPTIAELGAATLFPYAPDGQFPITVAEEWLTDVQPGADGTEVRQAVRSVGVRTLTFTALFALVELIAFRARWHTADAPLRFLVPVWPEFTLVDGIAGAVLTCDTTDRDFVTGGLAMLYRMSPDGTADAYELVTVDSFDDVSVTLAGAPTGSFPADGASVIIPVMTAWLDPPSVDELAINAERMALTFREELSSIAGIDGTITEDAAAVAAAITIAPWRYGSGFEAQQVIYRATVVDAGGVPIPSAPVTWSITPDEVADPKVRLSVTPDEQEARIEFDRGAEANHTLTAQSGAASVSIGLVEFVS